MSNLKGVITNISKVFEVGQYKKLYVHVKEDQGEYPQSANFEVFGEQKVNGVLQYNQVGDLVEVEYNLKSNESNKEPGVFFNTVQAWKISKV
jgi:hypothetical protein